ncbi:hypothetical protein [Aestuariicoccus sp. MJ-SS9]|uniref:hypothetical protein n=1 Tax=Aestuariicoccus sp. MJ-SS9 TaxID=3079855 RepID=UPI00290EA20A|nr:hypothetical protein [Aestuariicoccus sp. MJ-SS9]MDU8910923.1 hypothetical protein [Aestuariicoccus sp. MJ-SS9]
MVASCGAATGGLDARTYVIELTSSQFVSGYGGDLVPPLVSALGRKGMRAVENQDAEVVVNIVTDMDVGQWMWRGDEQKWIYTVRIMVGISPVDYVIPEDGTPVFGVRVRLETPNPDREDELGCLIRLAARTAVEQYRPAGMIELDGQECLRA